MTKEWENVLGQMVLFEGDAAGGWTFECHDIAVTQDKAVRYPTQAAARLAAASMIFAFFVMEEVTSRDVPSSTKPVAGSRPLPGPFVRPPAAGGGGR